MSRFPFSGAFKLISGREWHDAFRLAIASLPEEISVKMCPTIAIIAFFQPPDEEPPTTIRILRERMIRPNYHAESPGAIHFRPSLLAAAPY
jgi:hypothetical protein